MPQSRGSPVISALPLHLYGEKGGELLKDMAHACVMLYELYLNDCISPNSHDANCLESFSAFSKLVPVCSPQRLFLMCLSDSSVDRH